MNKIHLSLPPLPEQQSIAAILSSLDDKIELLREQNKTLEELGQRIFEQKFKVQKNGAGGLFKFKDLVSHIKPGTNYQPERLPEGVPFVNGRNVKNGFLALKSTSKISIEEYQRVHKTWQVEENDIFITRIGTLGNVAIVRKSDLPLSVHYNIIVIKEGLICHEFIYFFLK